MCFGAAVVRSEADQQPTKAADPRLALCAVFRCPHCVSSDHPMSDRFVPIGRAGTERK
jgi:hypothetical protein